MLSFPGDGSEEPVVPTRRPSPGGVDLDIAPMIDVTFLLLIFFLITSVPQVQAALDLPAARHGTGVSRQQALVVTLAPREGNRSAAVYLADSLEVEPLTDDPAAQSAAVRQYVQQGLLAGRPEVLIKAGRNVRYRDVARIAESAAAVAGARVNLAVREED